MMKKYWFIVICVLISVVSNAQNIQFLDATGKAIAQEKFSDFYSSKSNTFIVKQGNLFGLMDAKKGLVIKCEYDQIKPNTRHADIFAVKKGSNWGIMNTKGETLLPIEYEEIKSFDDELAIVSIDFYWVLINYKGEKIVEAEYEDASNLINNREAIWFKKKDQYTLFDRAGKELFTQSGWVSLDNVAGNHLQTVSNGWHKSGVYDINSQKLIVPLQYDMVKAISDDLVEVAKCRYEFDGFGPSPGPEDFIYGIYSASQQKEIVPCTYDNIEATKEYIKANINGGSDYYSPQGKVMNPENVKLTTDLNEMDFEIVIPAFDDIYVIKRNTGRYKWSILDYANKEFAWLEFLSEYYSEENIKFIKSGETTFPFILFDNYGTIKIHGRDGKMTYQMKYSTYEAIESSPTAVVYRNYDPKKSLVTYLEFSKDGSVKELSDYEDGNFVMPFKNDAGQFGLKKMNGTIVEEANHKSIRMKKYGEHTVFVLKSE